MATLATSKTTAVATAGVSHAAVTSVQAYGTFDGAILVLEASQADVGANYIVIGTLSRPGWIDVPLRGTYFLRVSIRNLGAATSISVVSG